VLPYSIADNLVLCTYYRRPFAHGIQRDDEAVAENAVALVEEYDVRTPSPFTVAGNLSGGNQQKVIVARELSRPVHLVIANQPTRGLDVGSIEFIHQRIIEERDAGVAILLISAELDEILALADRIAVIYHGQIVATLPAQEATREKLGLLMAGSGLEKEEGAPPIPA
jgi:simple sugar transport system ATP-binding protein